MQKRTSILSCNMQVWAKEQAAEKKHGQNCCLNKRSLDLTDDGSKSSLAVIETKEFVCAASFFAQTSFLQTTVQFKPFCADRSSVDFFCAAICLANTCICTDIIDNIKVLLCN